MARETFIDTSGFYALLVASDTNHPDAEAWLKAAKSSQARSVTTDYVLDETATLLKAKGQGHLAKDFSCGTTIMIIRSQTARSLVADVASPF